MNEKQEMSLGVRIVRDLAVLFMVLFMLFIYYNHFAAIRVGTAVSPDGDYKVIFHNIGQPPWPFGAATARVTVKEGRFHVISKEKLYVYNDGGCFTENNWEVQWFDDHVVITIKSIEAEDQVYSVFFEDE